MAKGSILDLAGIMLIVALLVITSFLIFKIYNGFRNVYNPVTTEETQMLGKIDTGFGILINAIPIIIFASGIGSIILAFLIPTHPVFMPISIFLLVFFIITSFFFKTFVYNFISSNQISGISGSYPILVNIINYLPLIIGSFGFILIIVMYSKSSGGYE